MRNLASATLLFLILLVSSGTAIAQSPDAVADLAARINRERIARGLVPYALNAQLIAAAQAHASDIAHTGKYSHTGSDGSTVFDRVARAGYGAYSWGRRVGENWAWYRNAAAALGMWMNSPPHRRNILHSLYREIGIGIAPAPSGGFIYVINFGAQSNVLPIFISDGAAETRSLSVNLTLSNEDVLPGGDGVPTIGRATEVQISNAADFAGGQWQPFASRIAWTLPPDGGTKTVYVRYRDARGRTVTSTDSIFYGAATVPTTGPTLTATRTPQPTSQRDFQSTATRTPPPTSTATRTLPPTSTATRTPPPTSTATRTPPPTSTATRTLSLADAQARRPVPAAAPAPDLGEPSVTATLIQSASADALSALPNATLSAEAPALPLAAAAPDLGEPSVTATLTQVASAYALSEASPNATLSAEVPAAPLPTATVGSLAVYVLERTGPVALGIFGIALVLVLGTLALVECFGSVLKI